MSSKSSSQTSSSRPGPRAAQLSPPSSRRRWLRSFWLPAVLLLALAAGGLTGIIIAYELNYSRAANEVALLATYRPGIVTRVYADDGETIIGEFALERRIPLRHEQIPPVLHNAILAVEDARFYEHMGIDPIRIAGVVFKNLTTGSREGGSTLTQQLVKNLFLSREQTLERKMNEWLIALQVERFYTKQQIMEMYVNHIFLGARAYGFEAAAQTYFNKSVGQLTLDEAALLAGIPRSPSRYSPTVDPTAARERRNLVLELMARNGFVSQAEAEAAKARPIRLVDTAYHPPRAAAAPYLEYPVEEIRQWIEERYTTRVAQGGLTVYSTINVAAQRTAYDAVRAGLRAYDRGYSGWRSAYTNIGGEGQNAASTVTPQQLAAYAHPHWYGNNYEQNSYVMGLVMSLDQARNEATVRFGNYTATVTARDMGRSGRQPRAEFKLGDLAEFQIKEVDTQNRRLKVELSQIPAIQGALVSLNARTGEVIAMIGGYDFHTSRFNNATQAYRQTGSAFKPFIYTAAVEWGMTPESRVSGAPFTRVPGWTPHNYDGSTSNGDTTLRHALARSLNVPAVHLLDMVGIQTGAQMVRRFGITVPMSPYLPSALGATEVPLIQMVSAYSAFPNRGVRVEPHLVRRVLERDGTVLEEWERTTYRVTSEYVALTMVDMMRGVVGPGGTAPAASSVGVQLAGKTGTVNDHTDVWFIGYTPTYVTGVWLGYQERKISLGRGMTGGRGALPIFIEYMKALLRDKEREEFPRPPAMPEDMRELQRQRQREISEDRAAMAATSSSAGGGGGGGELPAAGVAEPQLEQITLPPPPGESSRPPASAPPAATESAPAAAPQRPAEPPPQAPPAGGATRPREVEPTARRRGKRGEGSAETP